MAKKSMKESATAGISTIEMLTSGNIAYGRDADDAPNVKATKDASDTQNVQDVQNAKDGLSAQSVKTTPDTKATKDAKAAQKKPKIKYERLNLKIPADIKEHLTVQAAKASIERRRSISLTEYLCELVRADMERAKE